MRHISQTITLYVMEQLFKALPRDLQWHILSEYVGSHAVRKGRLIQKLEFGPRHKMVQEICRIYSCDIWLYKANFNTKTYAQMEDGSQMMFCQDPVTGELGYVFRKRRIRKSPFESKSWSMEYTPMIDSVILPPFEKHSYPSFEDTDKKQEARFQ